MIDLSLETALSLSAAARRLPSFRAGKAVSPATVWRWICAGTRRRDGTIVHLEGIRLGSRWLTSVQALQRFAQALTAADAAPVPTARRKQDAEQAKRELLEAGI